jgi:hypothetical protein
MKPKYDEDDKGKEKSINQQSIKESVQMYSSRTGYAIIPPSLFDDPIPLLFLLLHLHFEVQFTPKSRKLTDD